MTPGSSPTRKVLKPTGRLESLSAYLGSPTCFCVALKPGLLCPSPVPLLPPLLCHPFLYLAPDPPPSIYPFFLPSEPHELMGWHKCLNT